MRIESFKITRFHFRRDRVIGDSQVQTDTVYVAALELVDTAGNVGLGFMQSLFTPLPSQSEIERIFTLENWPGLESQLPVALVHRVTRLRGGNHRAAGLPAYEAIQVALWDLFAKQLGQPLWRILGATRQKVCAYASGLDFHLSDKDFVELFGKADAAGYAAFKIKVGHTDFGRDLHRLELLRKTVRKDAQVMIDVNEAWEAKEAAMKISAIRDAGHKLLWVEDPIARSDFEGLRLLRRSLPFTMINSGEYLDTAGKLALLRERATDILNVHGQVTDVMRIGWVAADLGIPVSLGNTFLEVGVHMAVALPDVEWMEYSFQNFDHLVEEPIRIVHGEVHAPDRPGHGLELSAQARQTATPDLAEGAEVALPG
jgi:L-alanine-DL-glutamate epimerase-like enolase superfamily enzyme